MAKNLYSFELTPETMKATNSVASFLLEDTQTILKLRKSKEIVEIDEPTYAKLKDVQMKDGIIEVMVLSRLLDDAPDYARGFIGIAFRINQDDTQFESIYIRPTNGRTEDEQRRAHAIQYFSYPDYKFFRTREETPGKYESGADIGLDEWVHIRIVVIGSIATLYLNHSDQPSLVVNDLKQGPDAVGSIALWVDIGTEGYFKDLKFSPI